MTDRELLEELRRLQAETKPAAAPATVDQKIRASTAMRVVQGARDPIDAGAQLLPKGLQAVTGLFGLAPNPVSEFFGAEDLVDMGASDEVLFSKTLEELKRLKLILA